MTSPSSFFNEIGEIGKKKNITFAPDKELRNFTEISKSNVSLEEINKKREILRSFDKDNIYTSMITVTNAGAEVTGNTSFGDLGEAGKRMVLIGVNVSFWNSNTVNRNTIKLCWSYKDVLGNYFLDLVRYTLPIAVAGAVEPYLNQYISLKEPIIIPPKSWFNLDYTAFIGELSLTLYYYLEAIYS